jgi:hypothetical protein
MFSRVLRFLPPIKLSRDITEILLKVALYKHWKIIHFHARNLNTILKQLYEKAAMQNKKKNSELKQKYN